MKSYYLPISETDDTRNLPLRRFRPHPPTPDQVTGRVVSRISDTVGTYGTGGHGFFGLELTDEWLVVALNGAAEWMTCKGRLVGDSFHDRYGRERPWIADWITGAEDQLTPHLVGQRVSKFELSQKELSVEFENGFDLTIVEDSSVRPRYESSQEPMVFVDEDDLRQKVFFSPTDSIWIRRGE